MPNSNHLPRLSHPFNNIKRISKTAKGHVNKAYSTTKNVVNQVARSEPSRAIASGGTAGGVIVAGGIAGGFVGASIGAGVGALIGGVGAGPAAAAGLGIGTGIGAAAAAPLANFTYKKISTSSFFNVNRTRAQLSETSDDETLDKQMTMTFSM